MFEQGGMDRTSYVSRNGNIKMGKKIVLLVSVNKFNKTFDFKLRRHEVLILILKFST